VVVGIDEAGDDDAIGGIDNRGVSRGKAGTHLANLAIFDQHVGLREVPDLTIEREHDAPLDQDAALSQHARKLCIVALGLRSAGEYGGGCSAANETCAQAQKLPA